jgi:hypothetical protein
MVSGRHTGSGGSGCNTSGCSGSRGCCSHRRMTNHSRGMQLTTADSGSLRARCNSSHSGSISKSCVSAVRSGHCCSRPPSARCLRRCSACDAREHGRFGAALRAERVQFSNALHVQLQKAEGGWPLDPIPLPPSFLPSFLPAFLPLQQTQGLLCFACRLATSPQPEHRAGGRSQEGNAGEEQGRQGE